MYLFGIQLGFTNGSQSPYFHTKYVNDETELNWTEIDTSRTIRKVSVYLTGKTFISRLRFIDENDENIIELLWDERDTGKWVSE